MTGQQLPLFEIPYILHVPHRKGESWKERFDRFHEANPSVYEALRKMSLWMLSNNKRAGFRMLYEQLRWSGLQTHDEPYKLNNNYAPYYTRLLMEQEPELEGYFAIRGEGADC